VVNCIICDLTESTRPDSCMFKFILEYYTCIFFLVVIIRVFLLARKFVQKFALYYESFVEIFRYILWPQCLFTN